MVSLANPCMIVFTAWWPVAPAVAIKRGAPECPCITSASALFTSLQADLVAANRSEHYGTAGCKAYDENNTLSGCASNEAAFCLNPWCYVDMKLCPINEDLCADAGGKVGIDRSPYCRSRPFHPSTVVSDLYHYSYETCGSLDVYDTSALMDPVAGRVLKIAVDAWAPWLMRKIDTTGREKYGGVLYDMFSDALTLFDPAPVEHIVPGWATQGSRAKFQSSYTACVHDIAVGNFDICVADLWRTHERAQLSHFAPALRHDYFYLVVPKKIVDDTLATRLGRPFLPFKPAAWGVVIGFTCGMSILLWLTQLWANGRSLYEQSCKARWTWCVCELGRSIFQVWHDFLGDAPTLGQENTGPAHRIFKLGFAFFVLIIIASYTASLASMLVVEKQAVASISSIQGSIEQDVTICVPEAVQSTLSTLYPTAFFANVGWQENVPRSIYAETCGAGVLSQGVLDSMHAGNIQKADCKAVADGVMAERDAHCQQGLRGLPRNDCDLMRVGEILLTVPVAYPVSAKMSHSFTWAFSKLLSAGSFEELTKKHRDAFPQPKCDAAVGDKESGLESRDLLGTLVISILIVAVGVLCLVGETVFYECGWHERFADFRTVETTAPNGGADGAATVLGSASGREATASGMAN